MSWCLCGSNKPSDSRNYRGNSHWLSTLFLGDVFCCSFWLLKRPHTVLSKISMCPCILQYCTAISNSSNYFGDTYWMQCNMLQRGLFLTIKSCLILRGPSFIHRTSLLHAISWGQKRIQGEPDTENSILGEAFLSWSQLKLHRWLI